MNESSEKGKFYLSPSEVTYINKLINIAGFVLKEDKKQHLSPKAAKKRKPENSNSDLESTRRPKRPHQKVGEKRQHRRVGDGEWRESVGSALFRRVGDGEWRKHRRDGEWHESVGSANPLLRSQTSTQKAASLGPGLYAVSRMLNDTYLGAIAYELDIDLVGEEFQKCLKTAGFESSLLEDLIATIRTQIVYDGLLNICQNSDIFYEVWDLLRFFEDMIIRMSDISSWGLFCSYLSDIEHQPLKDISTLGGTSGRGGDFGGSYDGRGQGRVGGNDGIYDGFRGLRTLGGPEIYDGFIMSHALEDLAVYNWEEENIKQIQKKLERRALKVHFFIYFFIYIYIYSYYIFIHIADV
eukprot:GHVL01017601.1.p1 GENE.GHVL01017601.1~~GHVL01017601.1.p1  ORF type:complete len:375 (-),score=92.16 GHVL01017601.1:250-1308(-)